MQGSHGTQAQKKAVLIELGGSHDINLYSQLLFLKHGGYHTTLVVDERVYKQVTEYDNVDVLIKAPMLTKLGKRIKTLWGIRNYIIKNNINVVVFNTAGGPLVRMLMMMPYPRRIKFTGTLHSLHKLKGSVTQKIISRRFGKYFLLTRNLVEKAKDYSKNLRFDFFYPMFYMQFPNEPTVTKPEGEIWVAIPGVVEYVRKDYAGLAHALAKLPRKLPLKFLLLGSSRHKSGDGADFVALIEKLGVQDYFKFWEGYVTNEDFHAYSKASDFMMPLIHPKKGEGNVYVDYQISGTWNMGFAYKKPLLLADDFAHMEDFKKDGVFYNVDTLPDVLMSLSDTLRQTSEHLYEDKYFQFSWQADNFLRFIES